MWSAGHEQERLSMNLNRHRSVAILLLFGAAVLRLFGAAEESTAVYHGLKSDEFMRRWLMLRQVVVPKEPEEAKKAFAVDYLKSVGGETNVQPRAGEAVEVDGLNHRWRLVDSKRDIVDLIRAGQPREHVIAYAWAEIEMAEPASVLFGIGSDDAIKVWLNGKVVHEHWEGRRTHNDEDLVQFQFRKGRNRLLLKVLNMEADWSFVCRPLGPAGLQEKLVYLSERGEVDEIKKLLGRGVGLNGKDKRGLTALQAAKIYGHKDVAELLLAKGADPKIAPAPREQIIDATFREIVREDDPGAAVLVAQNGKILFERGYGLANVEHRVPVTTGTKFRIGSITKQFVAAGILKLNEQGKLKLDDKLSKFIPDYPRGDEVTIHHLLTHTSGIHSYTGQSNFMATVRSPVSSEDLIDSFKNDPYDFDPGKKWLYNNSGFFLLGHIIRKVSGKDYGVFLRETFFEPLGMTNTGVHDATSIIEHEAHGYTYEGGTVKKAMNWDMSRAGGAGALYSTVEDLYRWNEGVFGGKVLSEASLKAAFTPVKTAESKGEDPKDGYGYGWGIGSLRGLKEIAHGGGLQGFTSFLLRITNENFTVAVLANSATPIPSMDTSGLAHDIATIYLADKLQPRPTVIANQSVSPKHYDAYVGRYDYGYGVAILTVTKEKDRLFAQLTGQSKFEIFPRSETEFFWKVVEASVTFVKDKNGKVVKAIHHQGGQTINAPRLPDEAGGN
jgi:CubicO group peptidase (beta-lactamase class C family)